jgi:hypothetical protein
VTIARSIRIATSAAMIMRIMQGEREMSKSFTPIILSTLESGPKTIKQIAESTGICNYTVRTTLCRKRKTGEVECKRLNECWHPYVYYLPGDTPNVEDPYVEEVKECFKHLNGNFASCWIIIDIIDKNPGVAPNLEKLMIADISAEKQRFRATITNTLKRIPGSVQWNQNGTGKSNCPVFKIR